MLSTRLCLAGVLGLVSTGGVGCWVPRDKGPVDMVAAADLLPSPPPDLTGAEVDSGPPLPSPAEILINMGTFKMGQGDANAYDVTLKSFYIDVAETTTALYAQCVERGVCSEAGRGSGCNAGVAGKESHPINCVDWSQAAAFCAWLNRRLPTEEEWEYVARGANGRTYPWGDLDPTLAKELCWERDAVGTCPVCSFRKTLSGAFFQDGVCDLAGNVYEWTANAYYPYNVKINQPCVAGVDCVRRGGDYGVTPGLRGLLEGKNRENPLSPTARNKYTGFRCARN